MIDGGMAVFMTEGENISFNVIYRICRRMVARYGIHGAFEGYFFRFHAHDMWMRRRLQSLTTGVASP